MGRKKNIVYKKDELDELTSGKTATVKKKEAAPKTKRKKKEEEVLIEPTDKEDKGIVVDLYETPKLDEDDQNIVELVTSQCPPIKTLFETLNGILSNINLYFTPKGIYIRALNRDETINVNAELWGDRFEHYCFRTREKTDDMTEEERKMAEEHIVGIRLVTFYKIISTLGANNILTIYVDKNSPERLGTRIEIKERSTIHDYSINRLNIKVLRMEPIDPDEYPVIISIPSNYFQKICRDANRLVDRVEISHSQNDQLNMRFDAEGVTQETIIGKNKDYLQFVKNELDEHEIIQGVYSLKDLVSFSKCTSISDNVLLHLSNEYPLMVQYGIGNLGFIQLFMDEIETD